jgi:hypothetical protein
VLITDPLSVWWGLKSSRDLTQPGVCLSYISGDQDADVPINGNVGEAVIKSLHGCVARKNCFTRSTSNPIPCGWSSKRQMSSALRTPVP